jgi:hypothetical protein
MKNVLLPGLLLAALAPGCKSHLFFVEESHWGLKAKISASQTTPFDVDLGYRRGMIVFLPKKSGDAAAADAQPVVQKQTQDGKVQWTVSSDPGDLMSLYTRFDANVGFFDPVRVRHFLATGDAAAQLIANESDLNRIGGVFADDAGGGGGGGE